jgi:hypothetical protein
MRRSFATGLLLLLLAVAPVRAQDLGQNASDFAEGRTGDIPAGAAELVTPETDRATHEGLAWLAQQQNDDGSFGTGAYKGNIAVTALCGLSFMSAGSTPGRGPYGPNIDRALAYVLDNTSNAGFVCVQGSATHGPMYSHGFGTLFLAEAYGMSRRPELREKLERAVRLIVSSQNKEGGWRYQPQPNDADISVTICQINALRAARNAGIFVPKETVEACIKYVKDSQNTDGGFRYLLQPGTSAFPRSAAGVVALQSAGIYYGDEIDEGIAYLKQFQPDVRFGRRGRNFSHYFYGHYYAAQALWIRGGDDWTSWYTAVRDELLDPRNRSPQGYWTDTIGNDYATAMAVIILQIPNNYLPIFQR